jgi:hypothetical protein
LPKKRLFCPQNRAERRLDAARLHHCRAALMLASLGPRAIPFIGERANREDCAERARS